MRSKVYDVIILRAMDVGEADKFCILLSKEAGKFAARARGVRKPGSKLGGMLMQFAHVKVQIAAKENPGTIQSVTEMGPDHPILSDYRAFSCAQQGVELLLSLLEDEDPMPEVFEAVLLFLEACAHIDHNPLPAFTIRFLHLLGVLPLHDDDMRFNKLSDTTQQLLIAVANAENPFTVKDLDDQEISSFLQTILNESLPRPLKAEQLR